jgi:hypothetical protein
VAEVRKVGSLEREWCGSIYLGEVESTMSNCQAGNSCFKTDHETCRYCHDRSTNYETLPDIQDMNDEIMCQDSITTVHTGTVGLSTGWGHYPLSRYGASCVQKERVRPRYQATDGEKIVGGKCLCFQVTAEMILET